MYRNSIILLVISTLFFHSCLDSYNTKKALKKVDANKVEFTQYKGKVIREIIYCDGCGNGGDDLLILFEDGTQIKFYVYKYNMKTYLNEKEN